MDVVTVGDGLRCARQPDCTLLRINVRIREIITKKRLTVVHTQSSSVSFVRTLSVCPY